MHRSRQKLRPLNQSQSCNQRMVLFQSLKYRKSVFTETEVINVKSYESLNESSPAGGWYGVALT